MESVFSFHGYEQPLEIYGQRKTTKTGETTGIEILLRAQSGDRSSSEIIEHFEDMETIHEVTLFVLRRACEQLENLIKHGIYLSISINIAPMSFYETIVSDIENILSETGVPASLITLEITERHPVEDFSFKVLHDLRETGVEIAMDDFGEGYANMNTLNEIRKHGDCIKEVKLDKKYLADMDELGKTAKNLMCEGYDVTVEGVETKEQLSKLPENVTVQGYVYSVPKPLSKLAQEIIMEKQKAVV